MTKREIAKATDHDLIIDYIDTFAINMTNFNTNRGIKETGRHLNDLEAEMLKRNIFTEADVRHFNS